MPKSRFIPNDFDAARPVAVIAGKGRYPELTIEALRAQSIPVRLIAFKDETRETLYESFPPAERTMIQVGQIGKMLKSLKKMEAGYAIMAGQITPRRLFDGLMPDVKAVRMLASLKKRNAETIFGAIAKEIAAIDVNQLDARAFLDQHLAHKGAMNDAGKTIHPDVLSHGIEVARHIAQMEIGQGVVVSEGTILAVEAFEGTDPMLERAGTFGAKDMVFVKISKPGQDCRFDVPVFGTRTLQKMQEAGIGAAALQADSTLMLDKENVIAEATKKSIALVGY